MTNAVVKVQLIGQESFGYSQVVPWLIALAAFSFSLYQYLANTRVKRLDYLDNLAKTLREEPLLRTAVIMLDWEVRTTELNEERYPYSVICVLQADQNWACIASSDRARRLSRSGLIPGSQKCLRTRKTPPPSV